MAYNVHIFTVVRVTVEGMEGPTPLEAIVQAREAVDFYALFDRPNGAWAEKDDCYRVDVVGDEEYEQSQWFDDDMRPL